jgi:murein DD-endopeptidase MepM/ murein hydrolase activator NlpD
VAGRAPFVTGGIAGVGVPTADALARSLLLAARSAPPGALPPHGSGSMRQVAFPVLGPTTYYDGWNDCRDGCTRRHEGTDLIGVRMQPLLAAVDGVVTRIDHDNPGISGVALAITDADGWRYNYFHLNNDLPGTDDRRGAAAWRTPPGLQVGDRVRAGQVIGYMGDSGNAEVSVPHLHFEIRDPSGTARPSFWSLEAAKARQACSIGLGPWSVVDTPTAVSDDVEVTTVTPAYGDGVWSIDSDGRVIATGDAALIMPSRSIPCDHGPTVPFGTDAAGWVIVDGRPAYHDPTVDAADRLARTRRLAGYRLPPMSI